MNAEWAKLLLPQAVAEIKKPGKANFSSPGAGPLLSKCEREAKREKGALLKKKDAVADEDIEQSTTKKPVKILSKMEKITLAEERKKEAEKAKLEKAQAKEEKARDKEEKAKLPCAPPARPPDRPTASRCLRPSNGRHASCDVRCVPARGRDGDSTSS